MATSCVSSGLLRRLFDLELAQARAAHRWPHEQRPSWQRWARAAAREQARRYAPPPDARARLASVTYSKNSVFDRGPNTRSRRLVTSMMMMESRPYSTRAGVGADARRVDLRRVRQKLLQIFGGPVQKAGIGGGLTPRLAYPAGVAGASPTLSQERLDPRPVCRATRHSAGRRGADSSRHSASTPSADGRRLGAKATAHGFQERSFYSHAAFGPERPGDSSCDAVSFAARNLRCAVLGECIHEGVGASVCGLAGIAEGGGDRRAENQRRTTRDALWRRRY